MNTQRDDLRLTVPSRGDEVAREATEVFGGPSGRRAAWGRQGSQYAVSVLTGLSSLLVALGVFQKNHCVRSGWASPGSLWRACYSDIPVGVGSPGGPWAAGGPGQGQPVLTAILWWGLRKITPAGSSLSMQRSVFALAAVVIAVLVAIAVVATVSMLPSTPWQAAHVALSPVLVTSALVSLDMFGVALATAGMAAWYRKHPLTAGVLLGAAVMARSYPAIIIAAIVMIAVRDRRREDLVRMLAGVFAAIVVCLAVAYLWGGDPLAAYQNWNQQGSSYGSPWMILSILHLSISTGTLTGLAMLGWLAALGTGLALVTRPRHQTPLAPLALTMLVIVLATGKSMPVQNSLWVLPLFALCAIRWRDHLIWAGVEITYFVMVWMYAASSANAAKALPAAAYTVFCLVRLIAYGAMAWIAWETAEELQDHVDPVGAEDAESWLASRMAEHQLPGGDDSPPHPAAP